MTALTKRQRQILDLIEQFIAEHRHSPSYQEIAKLAGLRSLATVHKHVAELKRRGALRTAYNRARSIEVVPQESLAEAYERGYRDALAIKRAGNPQADFHNKVTSRSVQARGK